jgi:glutamate synthase domain-containing protein 3
VLDEDGMFAQRCNMGMVGFEAPAEADAIELREMIAEHLQRTDSPVAARVLDEFQTLLDAGAFVKVMPHDYKRVVAERAAEAAVLAGNGRAAAGGSSVESESPDGDVDSLHAEQEPA